MRSRLPRNNSEKLKNEIRQLLHSLCRSKRLTKQLYKSLVDMETIFMNTENSKTSEPHRFKLDLADNLNLKNPNKNMALANLSIYQNTAAINLKFEHQLGIILLIYLMVLIQFLIFRIILNLLLKNMKL